MLKGFALPSNFYYCKAGLTSIFVNIKGDFYPCSETDDRFKIGSVNIGLDVRRIREIVSINETQNKDCENCIEYKKHGCKICSCMMMNYIINNDIFMPPEIHCLTTKHIHNIFRNKYSTEQIQMLKNFYKEEYKWKI